MKYLLKWMNNCEKELLSSCEPLYKYANWVEQSSLEIAHAIKEAFDNSKLEKPDYISFDFLSNGEDPLDYISHIVEKSIEEYLRTYLPPSVLTLTPPSDGGPDILKSSTSLKDSLEVLHILIANIVAFPHTIFEIADETLATLTSVVQQEIAEQIVEKVVEPYLHNILKVSISEAPVALTNTKWGLKALTTYFFLKHSHKIQLTEVVQKMFEMTDVSDNLDISKNLKLPYPMNYIEFNKSLPMEMRNGDSVSVTGALMYEVTTPDFEEGMPLHKTGMIKNFPKENYQTIGTLHGLVGVDQVRKTAEDGYENTRMTYDKGLVPLCITKNCEQGQKITKDNVVMGMDKNPMLDLGDSHLMGIPFHDLPSVDPLDATINRLLTHNWEPMMTVGYGKLALGLRDAMPTLSELGILGGRAIGNAVIDPLYKYDKKVIDHNIKEETYTIIELIINYDSYSEERRSLWTNIGPYLEIGRRSDGEDLWETVKSNFEQNFDPDLLENLGKKNTETAVEAFKIALQSIWFINEPDVKLKEAPEEQPSNRRQYFPKTKVTNKRKIVLRGEINRYLKSLSKTVRSSPKGAWWVRGHWRNQWYPSIQDNKRKWIRPYVKGTGKATKKQVDLDPNTEV